MAASKPPKGKGRSRSKPRQSKPVAEASADSQTASEKDSSASTPLVDDPGPGFDPAQPGAEPELEEPQQIHAVEGPEWEPDGVLWDLLKMQGEALHVLAGVAEADWIYTEADLEDIAGPLSRILNRYDITRAMAAYGDAAALGIGLFRYTIRSARERKAVLDAAEQELVPVTGVPAPEPEPPVEQAPRPAPAGPAPTPPMPPPAAVPAPAQPTAQPEQPAPPAPQQPPPAAAQQPQQQTPVAQGQVDPRQVDWRIGG